MLAFPTSGHIIIIAVVTCYMYLIARSKEVRCHLFRLMLSTVVHVYLNFVLHIYHSQMGRTNNKGLTLDLSSLSLMLCRQQRIQQTAFTFTRHCLHCVCLASELVLRKKVKAKKTLRVYSFFQLSLFLYYCQSEPTCSRNVDSRSSELAISQQCIYTGLWNQLAINRSL